MGLCKLTEFLLQTDTRIIMTLTILSCSHMALAHNRLILLYQHKEIIMPNFLYFISVLDN